MEETDRHFVRKRNIGFAIAALLIIVLALVFVFNPSVKDKISDKEISETIENTNPVMLKMGKFSFWLICLGIILIGAFKLMEYSSKY